MRVLAFLFCLMAMGLPPQAAKAMGPAGAIASSKYTPTVSKPTFVHYYRRGYRTSADAHERKYFFPPYQWRVTRCYYDGYKKFHRKRRYGRTYRCWRRKPKYIKKRWHRHHGKHW